MAMRLLARVIVPLVLLVAVSVNTASGCSCLMSHPQKHACSADFVIVARVKKVLTPDENTRVFKVKVKKDFKLSEKASILLKSGRILTAGSSSLCGVNLTPEKTYLITGKVVAGKARVSLCNYITPWNQLTVRQKKGFRLLYRQNCQCEIMSCPWWKQCPKEEKPTNGCQWEGNVTDCQAKHGICMRSPHGGCIWSTDRKFNECTKMQRRLRDEKLRREP